ncbi:MAG: hypothetical protein M3N24_11595 [Actinomycetota bacterium]|nr:hypothetical protein [Actinomycetota bacterium]
MTPTRKLTTSVGLFALTLILVAGAAATRSVAPLFVAWVPLGLVAWVLTRPGPDWEPSPAAAAGDGPEAGPVTDDSSSAQDAGRS